MTAEVHARLADDGTLELDASGAGNDYLTLLAAYADAIAESTGGRPQGVLERAQSRVVTMRRRGEHRVVATMEADG